MKMQIEATKRLEEREKNFQQRFDKKLKFLIRYISKKNKAEEACKALRKENLESQNKINKELNKL